MGLTEKQIREMLQSEQFEYHRVDLPYGLHTSGQDRSGTAEILFREDVSGASFLDLGCALGHFCFEAERRGASPVVGIDLSESRIRQARRLAEVLESEADFRQGDFLTDPPSGQFDYVVLLNVVHHLVDPIAGLRMAVELANKALVIEFPNLSDAKFRRFSRIPLTRLLNRYPLIGVSSLRRETDQTFVFTRAAITQILSDHTGVAAEMEFHSSPMHGRDIAVFYPP